MTQLKRSSLMTDACICIQPHVNKCKVLRERHRPIGGALICIFIALSQRTAYTVRLPTHRGFRAQRFYLKLLPVLVFLHHSTDLDEPDKPVMSVFLISQHRKSYKPYKNRAISASAYLLCAQRFYHSPVFDRTFVQTLTAPCVSDRSGTKVLCVPTLSQIQSYIVHEGSICSDSTFEHYNIWLYKALTLQ